MVVETWVFSNSTPAPWQDAQTFKKDLLQLQSMAGKQIYFFGRVSPLPFVWAWAVGWPVKFLADKALQGCASYCYNPMLLQVRLTSRHAENNAVLYMSPYKVDKKLEY